MSPSPSPDDPCASVCDYDICQSEEDAAKPECYDCISCHYQHEPHPHHSPGPHYSPDPVDCRHVPDLCTDVCVNFAYCADPMAQDDNCVNAPPNCGEVCEPYIQCIGFEDPDDPCASVCDYSICQGEELSLIHI